MTKPQPCEAPHCIDDATGIVVIEHGEAYFCNEHLALSEAMWKRALGGHLDRGTALLLTRQVEPDQLHALAVEFDRLNGTNVAGEAKLSPIERMVDEATGRVSEDRTRFFEFLIDAIQRMPQPADQE